MTADEIHQQILWQIDHYPAAVLYALFMAQRRGANALGDPDILEYVHEWHAQERPPDPPVHESTVVADSVVPIIVQGGGVLPPATRHPQDGGVALLKTKAATKTKERSR